MVRSLIDAFAPVLKAFCAHRQEQPAVRARAEQSQHAQSQARQPTAVEASPKESKGLPEIEYPSPFVVRNTFIDADIGRSLSLDGFFEDRQVRSSPASAIDAVLACEEEAKRPALTRAILERLHEVDRASSCSSTSAGSMSPRSSAETPNGCLDASPVCADGLPDLEVQAQQDQDLDASPTSVEVVPDLEASPLRATTARLPELDYPVNLLIKNTFIHARIERSPSLDGFYEERLFRSCPVSMAEDTRAYVEETFKASCSNTDTDDEGDDVPGRLEEPAALGNVSIAGVGTWQCPPTPHFLKASMPPMAQPQVAQAAAALFLAAPVHVVPIVPAAPAGAAVVLELSQALASPVSEAVPVTTSVEATLAAPEELPSVGSADHHHGTCKPCAHVHSARGCNNGRECPFCHLCPRGELKRRQKANRQAQRLATQSPTSA